METLKPPNFEKENHLPSTSMTLGFHVKIVRGVLTPFFSDYNKSLRTLKKRRNGKLSVEETEKLSVGS